MKCPKARNYLAGTAVPTSDLGQSERSRLEAALTIAKDALREIATNGCLVPAHDGGEGYDIDPGVPTRVAYGALRRIREAEEA